MFAKLRLLQIRLFSTLLELCGRTSAGQSAIVRLRGNLLIGPLLRLLVGYRATFASFKEAETSAAPFAFLGHQHPDNIAYHSRLADSKLRESDYPVLFYLAPLAPSLRTVFDLGGSVGNLFYALQNELKFPDALRWQIYDLPMMRAAGTEFAQARKESRIRYVDSLSAASGCDLFVASGSLHYFQQPLAEILVSLSEPPRHLLINRTPCTSEAAGATDDVITVQDNDSYLVPCKVHNPLKLAESLNAIGYALHASWPVYERHLWLPLYPELSSRHYSGFYFVRSGG